MLQTGVTAAPWRSNRRLRAVSVAAIAAALLTVAGCGQDDALTTPDGSTISTSTTRFAEVNIVSADRDYAKTCLAPTAPDDGQADVNRIVVTDPALLDPICALGLGPKVTAVTSAPGSIPAYLGPQLGSVPTIGSSPDASATATAAPDVVLTTPRTASSSTGFGGAKVVSIDPASGWEEQFQAVADGLDRSAAGQRLLEEFRTEATKTGRRMDAAHTQASLVRFFSNSEMIAGTSTFAGQILSLIGVQRPESQRGPQSFTVTDENFTDADADLIYVSYVGDAGRAHGKDVLLSDRWLDMGAPTWKRVLSVDDDVWYRSSGLAAGWLVLNDVKNSLDGNS